MADFDNLFDAAIARADETIRGYMGTSATMTSGEQSGAVMCASGVVRLRGKHTGGGKIFSLREYFR